MTWEVWIEDRAGQHTRDVIRVAPPANRALAASLSRTVTATLMGWKGPAGEFVKYVRDVPEAPPPAPAPRDPDQDDKHL